MILSDFYIIDSSNRPNQILINNNQQLSFTEKYINNLENNINNITIIWNNPIIDAAGMLCNLTNIININF